MVNPFPLLISCLPKILRSASVFSILCICFFPSLQAQGGYTLDFDGVDDYVSIPHAVALNPAQITVEAWFYPADIAGQTIPPLVKKISSNQGYALEINQATSELRFHVFIQGDTWYTSPAYVVPSIDQWYHAAGTYDGNNIRLYVNGVNIGATAVVGIIEHSTNPLTIGYDAVNVGRYWEGKIDDVRIWSDIRTQAEVQANMHKELTGAEGNLVAYYDMSNGSGVSLADNSANNNTGTLTNGPIWKTSAAHAGPKMALDFDGVDDDVTIPDANEFDFTNDFTLEGWINPTAFSGFARMISKDDAYGLGFSSTIIRFTTYNVKDYDLTYSIPTGTWTHVAITMDTNNDVIFYVNGVNVGTIAGTAPATITTDPVLIGNSTYNAIEEFDGALDEIKFWSGVRTEAEIRANMHRTLNGDETNLVAYYRFDQQADAGNMTLYDYSSNGFDGTLNNMAPASDWITSDPFNTWIGSEDSDWTNADNWSSGAVPTSTMDVGVYNWNGTNAPTLSGTANAKNAYIGSGISLTNTGTVNLTCNLFNEGTLSGAGVTNFVGTTAQVIDGTGTTTFGTLTVNNTAGVSLLKDVTTSAMALTDGALTIGANTLTVNGAITQTTGTLAGGSTSNLGFGGAGASTTLPTVTINNLTLNRANGIALGGTVTVNGALTLTSGVLDLNSNLMILGDAASVAGSPANSNHVNAASGSLRKGYSAAGSFAFPVGDGTVYSPITLDFTSGTFTTANATVSLTATKHGSNNSPTHFIDRFWTVNSSGITGFSCDVTATYDNTDINGTEAEMHGGKWDGSEWLDLGDVTAASNQITGTVTSFSDFTAGDDTVFPVEWLSFEAEPKDNKVFLDWTTATEFNSDFFKIERSVDANIWNPIGKTDASGVNTGVSHYQFVDATPIIGIAYYRLQQVDMDGTFNYSPIVEVTMWESGVSIYPNPVQDVLKIDLGRKKQLFVTILDLTGRKLLEKKLQNGNNTLQLGDLIPGIYFIHVTDKKGYVQKQKMLKK